MSAFEQAKEAMMLLITMFVVVFVSIMFYIFLGNFQIGSNVDIKWEERELVMLRTLKCLENNEKLGDCLKTDKYMIKVEKSGGEIGFVNKKLYEDFEKSGEVYKLFVGVSRKFGEGYEITVWFENE